MNLESSNHHPMDATYIQEQLWQIPFNMQSRMLQAYSDRFGEILNDDTIPSYKRNNKARAECNTRLRKAVANLNRTYEPVA